MRCYLTEMVLALCRAKPNSTVTELAAELGVRTTVVYQHLGLLVEAGELSDRPAGLDRAILEVVSAGPTLAATQIAEQLGVGTAIVLSRLKKLRSTGLVGPRLSTRRCKTCGTNLPFGTEAKYCGAECWPVGVTQHPSEHTRQVVAYAMEHPSATLAAIGEVFSISRERVRQLLYKAGIKREARRSKAAFRDAVVAYYREHPYATGREVAEAVGCSTSCAYELRRDAGIVVIRTPKTGAVLALVEEHPDWTQAQIARAAGTSQPYVSAIMLKHGEAWGLQRHAEGVFRARRGKRVIPEDPLSVAVPDGECLVWPGGGAKRVPFITRNGTTVYMRRFVYEHHVGPLRGMWLVNLCGNPRCINPAHMRAVPAHPPHETCEHGHPLTEENLTKPGQARRFRRCRICQRASARRACARRRAERIATGEFERHIETVLRALREQGRRTIRNLHRDTGVAEYHVTRAVNELESKGVVRTWFDTRSRRWVELVDT